MFSFGKSINPEDRKFKTTSGKKHQREEKFETDSVFVSEKERKHLDLAFRRAVHRL
jgi:hypothetical protein